VQHLLLITLLFVLNGCFKSDAPAPATSSGVMDDCSLDISFTYTTGVDVTNDFILESISPTYVISSSNCSELPNGSGQAIGSNSWITRGADYLTVAPASSESPFGLQDYPISGSNLELASWDYCQSGYQHAEDMTHGELRSSDNTIRVTSHVAISYTGCASTTALLAGKYEHNVLKGIWKGSCATTAYGREQLWYGFYHNALVVMRRIFSGVSCSGTPDLYIEWNGPAAVGDTISSNIKELNYSWQNFYIKLYSTSLKNTFNSNTICGSSSWSTGSDISVKGTTCDLASINVTSSVIFPSDQTRQYDLFEIDGTTLYLGDEDTGDKSSSSERPTTVDSETSFSKDSSSYIIPDWAQ
jgi:hypothetical protein